MSAAQFTVKRAERKQARLRLAISAASNGGKTWSSIEVAFGIVEELLERKVLAGTLEGKVGLVDTERKSAQLFAHLGPFDTVELDPPYTLERYVGAMQALERAGVAVIILDSISHAWAGKGGMLELLNAFDDRERFSAFGKAINPKQDEFVDAMLRSPCHIIATMRSKTAWVLEDKEVHSKSGGMRTVKAPKRIGMAPVQRPGIEYEFTTLLDLDTDTHHARILKNRCAVFDNWTPKVLTRETGRQLAAWLLEGTSAPREAISGSPQERADAVHAAALRSFARSETIPDLARAFEVAQRDLKAFPPAVPVEAIRGLLESLVEAKDRRKTALADLSGATGRAEIQTIGPDDVIKLEMTLSEIGITVEDFKAWAGVGRLGALPVDKFEPAAQWLVDQATARGVKIERPQLHDQSNQDANRSAREVIEGTIEREAAKRGGLFTSMKDDIPWEA